jgi:hypothetical protein
MRRGGEELKGEEGKKRKETERGNYCRQKKRVASFYQVNEEKKRESHLVSSRRSECRVKFDQKINRDIVYFGNSQP